MFSNDLICNILQYLNSNLNRKIEITELAEKFYYDRYYIMKLFKKEIGVTITKYLNNIRIYNSIIDIQTNNYSFTKIALRNGFTSLEYFSETFKQVIEVSPQKYKNYYLYRNKINEKELSKIRKNLITLYEFQEKVKKYQAKRKPKQPPILKRTIFK